MSLVSLLSICEVHTPTFSTNQEAQLSLRYQGNFIHLQKTTYCYLNTMLYYTQTLIPTIKFHCKVMAIIIFLLLTKFAPILQVFFTSIGKLVYFV